MASIHARSHEEAIAVLHGRGQVNVRAHSRKRLHVRATAGPWQQQRPHIRRRRALAARQTGGVGRSRI